MIRQIYGINVAVKDLEAATERYKEVLGVEPRPMGPEDFAFPGLRGVTFRLGSTAINLITSEREDTAVARFLAKRGEGVFLVSLLSDAIEEDVEALKQRGAQFVLEEVAAGAFGKVNFIHPKSMHGVQFEIYEPPGRE
jgi:methylmalonyl-CoA/ethylmalonyl-CoA epimerase